MRLAFIDLVYAYDAARPDTDEPLGGTTSAICFLAREMSREGIGCTIFNRVNEAHSAFGIPSLPLESISDALGTDFFDAYIFCGRWTEELVGLVRKHTKKPLIAWMHESLFTPPMTSALDAFDGVVFVSEWQQRVNANKILPKWKQAVIRNAMNPLAAEAFGEDEPILAAKEKPPVLLFAGNFARGAFHVPPLVEKIRAKEEDFSVEMYCNLNPSGDAEKDAAYIDWLRKLPNIAHVGSVGQKQLLKRMRAASVMLAPNPWPETSCIALIEGMASGLYVVATARAALPETASGFARLVPIDQADHPVRFDTPIDYDAFAEKVLEALYERREKPEIVEERLRNQIAFFNENYQWAERVKPWVDFIKGF